MKTYSAKVGDVTRKWYIVDASSLPLGRLSTEVAKLLIGKDKPMFTKNIDCGDYVIIINSADLILTGKKMDQKMYYRHSGYPGGLKEISIALQIENDPTKVIYHSVRGMLPVNKLRSERLQRLKIYAGPDHNHEAQQPEIYKLGDGK